MLVTEIPLLNIQKQFNFIYYMSTSTLYMQVATGQYLLHKADTRHEHS